MGDGAYLNGFAGDYHAAGEGLSLEFDYSAMQVEARYYLAPIAWEGCGGEGRRID